MLLLRAPAPFRRVSRRNGAAFYHPSRLRANPLPLNVRRVRSAEASRGGAEFFR
ncbi:MAG: hypothetical protein IJK04_10395 [Kiritimatiellae bacterium]|nr:hypothetical protein [Kiritimatiellia bacterium]